MKKNVTKIAIITSIMLMGWQSFAQKFMGVGIEKPNPRAVIHLNVEDPVNFQQGFMPPRLTTAQRNNTAFTTVLAANTTLSGMTVFDIDVNAYFVWDGTNWVQMASVGGPTNLTAVGINGALVSTAGLSFTINGENFVGFTTLTAPRDIVGDFTNGFTVTGLSSFPITGTPSAATPILSFTGTAFQYVASPFTETSITGTGGIVVTGTDATGFTISGSGAMTTTLTGSSLINVDGPVGDYTITGIATSIVGANGIAVSGDQLTGFTVSGSGAMTTTLTGSSLINVDGPVGDYTITGIATSIVGANGIAVSGDQLTGFTISGSGAMTTTLTGSSLINVDGPVGDYTITGIATSIVGANGIAVSGDQLTGFTVSGSGAMTTTLTGSSLINVDGPVGDYTITGIATSIVGANGIAVSGDQLTGFTVSGSGAMTTTLTGSSLINVDGPVGDYTITGIATSIVGANGIAVSGDQLTGFTVSGSGAMTTTLTGSSLINVDGPVGDYTITGIATSIVGANGIAVSGDQLTGFTVSGSGAMTTTLTGSSLINVDGPVGDYTITGIATSIVGANGIAVSGDQLTGFTVSGSGAMTTTLTGSSLINVDGPVGDYTITGIATSIVGANGIAVSGDQLTGFTVSGSGAMTTTLTGSSLINVDGPVGDYTITGIATSIVGANGIAVSGDQLTGFTVSGSGAMTTTLTGSSLINVDGPVGDYTITGIATSIVGANGIAVSGDQLTGFTVSGSGAMTTTLTGSSLINVDGPVGDYTITGIATSIVGANGIAVSGDQLTGFTVTGPNIDATSVVGTAGMKVDVSGASVSVSGVGLIILQQGLPNVIGTSSTAALGTGMPILKAPIKLPLGVNKVRVTLNAYIMEGLGIADFRVQIGTAYVDEINISSTSPDNMVTFASDIDVSALPLSSPQLVRVYARVAGGEPAAYLGGITLTISE